MSPVPSLSMRVAPVNMMGRVKVMSALSVCRLPAKETVPAPLSLKGPLMRVEAPGSRMIVSEWLIKRGPAFVVITLPRRVKWVPARLIPPVPLVLRSPSRLVVPDPLDCWIDVAVIEEVVTVCALNVREPSRVVPPTAPEKVMAPVAPALTERLPEPLTVLERVMGWEEVIKEEVPATITGPAKPMVLPVEVIEPLS